MFKSFLISLLAQITLYFLFNFIKKRFSFDKYEAVQKIHDGEIPRIGGSHNGALQCDYLGSKVSGSTSYPQAYPHRDNRLSHGTQG